MNQQALSLALCITTLASASVERTSFQNTITIGSVIAKKYLLPGQIKATHTASSELLFASLMHTSSQHTFQQICVFDRNKNYTPVTNIDTDIASNAKDCNLVIIDERYCIHFCRKSDCLENSDNVSAHSKQVAPMTLYSAFISEARTIPNKKNCISLVDGHKRCVVMNCDNWADESSFEITDDSCIKEAIPAYDGNTIWYTTIKNDKTSISFYDMRSGKRDTLITDLPFFQGSISINAHNTRCAITNPRQLLIFDTNTKKEEQVIEAPEKTELHRAFFVSDNTIIYNAIPCEHDCKHDYDNDMLHSLDLTQKIQSHCIVPHSAYFKYHENTQLLLTTDHLDTIKAIYDFGNKQ